MTTIAITTHQLFSLYQYHLSSYVMMRSRKIYVAALLVLMTIMWATPLLYQVKISLVKLAATEHLKNEKLQTLQLPLSDIHWVKKGKELLVDQRLFDVNEYTVQDGYIVVSGLFDEEETWLDRQLEDFWQPTKAQQQALLLKYLQVVSSAFFQSYHFSFSACSIGNRCYVEQPVLSIKDWIIPVTLPPPQV